MFDLEPAIADWRQQMLAAGIGSPVPLEELEAHLREEIQRYMQSGLDGQEAFEISAEHIGRPEVVRSEFKKIERRLMEKILKMSGGLLVGGALMAPACLQLHDELVVTNGRLGLMLLGWGLVTWVFGQTLQFKLHKQESDLETVEMSPMKQSLKSGAGILGLLTGMALMIPAGRQALTEGLVRFDGLCYLVFGVALLIVGALVAFCPYKKLRA
jgi:hypothetical protein